MIDIKFNMSDNDTNSSGKSYDYDFNFERTKANGRAPLQIHYRVANLCLIE